MAYLAPRVRKRWQVIESLVKRHGWRRFVELGVHRADTMRHLLSTCPRLEYVGVDTWGEGVPAAEEVPPVRRYSAIDDGRRHYPRQTINEATARRFERAFPNRAVLRKMTTLEAAECVDGGSVDAVFIDADMRPAAIEADIRTWLPKLTPTGWLLGRDRAIPAVALMLDGFVPGYRKLEDGLWAKPAFEVRLRLEADAVKMGPVVANTFSDGCEITTAILQPVRRGPGRPRKAA